MTNVAIWESDAWLGAATDFVDERLRIYGSERTGPLVRSRVRPWSALLEAPTTGGRVWLKAASADTAFEVALYDRLCRAVPERVLTPLSVDIGRGWLLLPDGGALLGHGCDGDALARALERVVPSYAELQLTLMPHAPALVALGVADMRPHLMPLRFEQALANVRMFLERSGSAAEWREFHAVAALASQFAAWCAELAQAPGSASLDHNDLHPWNIFATPLAPQSARFFDWGDSVVAHPFASLLVLLATLQHTLEAPPGDARVLRVRDAYLEPFGALATRPELIATAALACRVAKAARVLTWQRAIGETPPADFAGIPFGKLTDLLHDR